MRDLMRVAQIQPVVHPGQIEAPPGPRGRDRRRDQGRRRPRARGLLPLPPVLGGRAGRQALARGHLVPAVRGAAAVTGRAATPSPREVRRLRTVPEAVRGLLPAIAASGGPLMDQLRTAVSLLGHSQGFRPWLDVTPDELRANALRVCAAVPTLIMALHRLGQGHEPIDPDPDLGYGENYLWMLTGERARRRQGPGRRAVPDPHHRPRVQRLDVHVPGHHLDRRRPGRRGHRRHRRPVGPAARRGAVAGARPARRHRHARERPALPGRRRDPRRQDHGLRPPGLQDRPTPAREFLREVAERIGAEKVDFATAGRAARSSTCWPSSSPAATSTPTSSSTPAS